MLNFNSDYMEGAHPEIIRRLSEINYNKNGGYGDDDYCRSAAEKILAACECPDAEVHFMIGGTQTNAVAIDALLRSYEGVISADTGHINGHEAGAVEFCGHKVIALPGHNGKLWADEVEKYFSRFYADATHTNMVFPGMVYISHPTESGTLYTADEIRALRAVCDKYDAKLYLDGARLGYGLAVKSCDVTLPFIASLCDGFYIGGTKVGAFFGEALVFTNRVKVPNFYTIKKQHGAVLAKGWLTGLQFDTLFTDGLYTRISENAIKLADKLRAALTEKGYQLMYGSPTNQVFVLLDNKKLEELSKSVGFGIWEVIDDDHSVIRLVTSWATSEEDIDALIALF